VPVSSPVHLLESPLLSPRPDDGGSKLFCNISQYLPDYTLQHPISVRRVENLGAHQNNLLIGTELTTV